MAEKLDQRDNQEILFKIAYEKMANKMGGKNYYFNIISSVINNV